MATITTNHIYDPYDQWFTMDYSFDGETFTWSVTPHSNNGSYRTDIYGLTVNVGGNVYYIGDRAWSAYTPNVPIYSGSTALANCTVNNGVVSLAVAGNFYYGTWNTAYRASGSATQAIVSPTVDAPTYTVSGDYNGSIVGNYSSLTFSMSATGGSTGTTISTYRLYIDGVQVYSGSANTCTVTAPSAGTHSVYVVAVESNGAVGQSSAISVTTVAYVAPSFASVTSVRWSTSDSTGQAADDGTHAKLSAEFTSAKIGGTDIPTYCRASVSTFTGTITTSGDSVYSGSILGLDNSYNIKYELYDDFIGVSNAIVRTDTISIGGRGFDMIHTTQGGYGVGFGDKAEAGRTIIGLPPKITYEPLWTNPDATYTSGTVTLDLSAYTHIVVGCYAWGTGYFEQVVKIGDSAMLQYTAFSADNTSSVQTAINGVYRSISVTSYGVTFGQGEMFYAGGIYRNRNDRCVPMYIWGFSKA